MELSDKVLFAVSICTAIVGLVLLFTVSPTEETRLYLNGTVIAKHGREAIVQANVTLIGRNLTPGKPFSLPVFWNGEAFVAVTSP
jgi:hypothetical protein